VGLWDRGRFVIPGPDSEVTAATVLVIVGSEEQMMKYEELMCIYQASAYPVIVIGAGRVGMAVASGLKERNIDCVMIDKEVSDMRRDKSFVKGNAADILTLKKAGIDRAPVVIITTNNDATNIYLTKYCRSLRPDMQIISRADAERNISTLHRAGAAFSMSYSSLGANTIFNYMENADTVMLAEGLDIFRVKTPRGLVGSGLAQSNIRKLTGCTVVALKDDRGVTINPDPRIPLKPEDELILIGSAEAGRQFIKRFAEK
jgi:Trk K+ transport system NAD-binding subunit